jgi:hypothetical protein
MTNVKPASPTASTVPLRISVNFCKDRRYSREHTPPRQREVTSTDHQIMVCYATCARLRMALDNSTACQVTPTLAPPIGYWYARLPWTACVPEKCEHRAVTDWYFHLDWTPLFLQHTEHFAMSVHHKVLEDAAIEKATTATIVWYQPISQWLATLASLDVAFK